MLSTLPDKENSDEVNEIEHPLQNGCGSNQDNQVRWNGEADGNPAGLIIWNRN